MGYKPKTQEITKMATFSGFSEGYVIFGLYRAFKIL
jgi:F0F1-type ATP synthase membrane subunit c/vacuolar-type H+-ATPase subunit K